MESRCVLPQVLPKEDLKMNEMNTAQTPVAPSGGAGSGSFKREVGLIPWWAYALAAIVFVILQWVFNSIVPEHPDRIFLGLLAGTIAVILILLIGYVNRDSARRGMNRTLWTLLVIFVPNALGFILYFLIRKPLRVPCMNCGNMLQPNFRYCPKCSTPRFAVCGHCNTPTEPGDLFCNNCGRMLHEPIK